jgi:hypothetical protein
MKVGINRDEVGWVRGETDAEMEGFPDDYDVLE